MYCIIALCGVLAAVCFVLYYGYFVRHDAVLWTGITTFTIMYHLWMRIIMGNITRLFRISYKSWWFREKGFEKKLYQILRVKKWKGSALTYNPGSYDLKSRTLTEIADTTAKSETDHWVNILISASTLILGLVWGMLWIFAVTAFAAALFDSQFIIIQRYNRPRLVKLIERGRRKSR